MRTSTVKNHIRTSELVSYYGPRDEHESTTHGPVAMTEILERDNITVSPKVDGYRAPTSYKARKFFRSSDIDGSESMVLGSVAEFFHYNVDPTASYEWWWRLSGNLGAAERHSGVMSPDSHPSYNDTQHLRTKVLNNLRQEIFDAPMVLAELRSTSKMLGTNLVRLGGGLDLIKRRKPDDFAILLKGKLADGRNPTDRHLRSAAGTYLEWKYGWTPTIMDIQGACEGLDMSRKGSLFDNPPLLVARAKQKSRTFKTVQHSFRPMDGTTIRCPVGYYDEIEHKARLDYRVSGEGLRGLNRYGIGLGTVATMLWDRKPFSFVLDMVVPIADLLKAWSALAGVDCVGYSETYHHRRHVPAQSQVGVWLRGNAIGGINIQETEAFCFERYGAEQAPIPLPYVKNPINPGNMATVLSLFTQLRK